MGWGKLGRDIIMAENTQCSALFKAKKQATQFRGLDLSMIVERFHANHV